jgi:hypothetical protein
VVPEHGLDAQKLAVLLRWGSGLQSDAREEVAAAGRAIVLLVEEIERLHVLLWDKRLYPNVVIDPPPSPPNAETRQPLVEALRARIRAFRHDRIPQADPAQEDSFNT